ncbi:sugar ABC transporter substrate-binding protein [Aestuariivirga sp.]|uniref:sugar ABC transporter substrate-binding protein n=1 Tax=Aestuariivirga sp. TaxID=2650926 RepID=UPI0039E32152
MANKKTESILDDQKFFADASRRDLFKAMGGAAALGAVMLADAGFDPAIAQELKPSGKPLKAAMGNAGLQATWCAQGKQAAEAWGKLMNVEITWFDGELSATKQRATVENLATQKWDFVALQTFGIGTLNEPIQRVIDAGTPVIAMDTMMAPEGQLALHTFIAPDNKMMGSVVTSALIAAIGGEGNVVMTQGALGHSGAQGRAKGFHSVIDGNSKIKLLDEQPADWDVTKVTRIWDSLLTQYPDIKGAFFHNDDMALAAHNVMKAKNRTDILIAGVDAMPPAVNAVLDGTMVATVRNPSCRIHGWAVAAGVAAVVGGEKAGKDIPNFILADGPVITKDTAAGHLWLQKNFLI